MELKNINEIPVPEKLDLISNMEEFIIRRSWFSLKVIPTAIFAIVWDSFLFFWYSTAFNHENSPWIMIVFPLGHVAVGIGITYFALCSFVNRTDIEITREMVKIKTYPLPWIGNKELRLYDIKNFSVRERGGRESSSSFDVMYIDANNREKRFIAGLERFEEADYIKQVTEIFL